MNQLEINTMNSFRLAKRDIIKMQSDIIALGRTEKKIVESLERLTAKETMLYNRVKQLDQRHAAAKALTIARKASKKKTYAASKDSNKFHLSNCPFAQNIKPKTKIKFNSRIKALNKGLKPCKCVK
ncbi:MAG: hypothetical protein GY861_27685 [bacterium]|nr:hypothetical protein [bacterium]